MYSLIAFLKSDNLQYNTLVRWDKRHIDQVSDVPSINFFIISYRLRALKTLYFYFCKVIKKLKGFLQRILQEIMKKKYILGTSYAWSMRQSTQHIISKIVGFQDETFFGPDFHFSGVKVNTKIKDSIIRYTVVI